MSPIHKTPYGSQSTRSFLSCPENDHQNFCLTSRHRSFSWRRAEDSPPATTVSRRERLPPKPFSDHIKAITSRGPKIIDIRPVQVRQCVTVTRVSDEQEALMK